MRLDFSDIIFKSWNQDSYGFSRVETKIRTKTTLSCEVQR